MIEHEADLFRIICLSKYPHQFCHTRFTGHIKGFNDAMFQCPFPYFIHGKVTAFVQALAAYNDRNTMIQKIHEYAKEIVPVRSLRI